jgi:hypothetical protein
VAMIQSNKNALVVQTKIGLMNLAKKHLSISKDYSLTEM